MGIAALTTESRNKIIGRGPDKEPIALRPAAQMPVPAQNSSPAINSSGAVGHLFPGVCGNYPHHVMEERKFVIGLRAVRQFWHTVLQTAPLALRQRWFTNRARDGLAADHRSGLELQRF